MFTQTALRACFFVLKRFFCQMQCFDWLQLSGALLDDTKNDCEGEQRSKQERLLAAEKLTHMQIDD